MSYSKNKRTQALPQVSVSRIDVGLLLLRCVMGCALSLHGWQKFVGPGGAYGWMGPETPVPAPLQALATFTELGGGVALIIGALTTAASLGIACTMLTAIFLVHLPQHQPFVAAPGQPSFESAAGYLATALTLIIAGPGTLSLDEAKRQMAAYLRSKRRPTSSAF